MFRNMKNAAVKLDIFFMLMLAFTYFFAYFTRFIPDQNDTDFIIMLNIFYLCLLICYFSNTVISLIACFVFVVGYGSYILYESVIVQKAVSFSAYVWIALIPLGCVAVAFFRTYLYDVQERVTKLDSSVESLAGFHEGTDLLNERMFYYGLKRYMAMARRGYIEVTLILVRVKFYNDIIKIIGREGIGELFKLVGSFIDETTRTEDDQYFVDEKGIFSIIAITDLSGAGIIKQRLKEKIKTVELEQKLKSYDMSLDLQIGMAQYTPEMQSAPEFRRAAEENLEFDV